MADPLETLYVEEVLTVAEVAENLRISPARIARDLLVAGGPGIPTETYQARRTWVVSKALEVEVAG